MDDEFNELLMPVLPVVTIEVLREQFNGLRLLVPDMDFPGWAECALGCLFGTCGHGSTRSCIYTPLATSATLSVKESHETYVFQAIDYLQRAVQGYLLVGSPQIRLGVTSPSLKLMKKSSW